MSTATQNGILANTETYVRYTEMVEGKEKTFVAEEISFDKYVNQPGKENVVEVARQSYLIPIATYENLPTLIPDENILNDFVRKAVEQKIGLRINREMKDKDFESQDGAVDTTPWIAEGPKRERLSIAQKAARLFDGLTPEQAKAQLEALINAMSVESENE